MKSFNRFTAAMGVCSLALCGSASAATLNFTNYIDTVANERA